MAIVILNDQSYEIAGTATAVSDALKSAAASDNWVTATHPTQGAVRIRASAVTLVRP